MGDKEPRRRKKNRRDSQKKDDVRSEDPFFVLPKSESKDSDQEPEEETVVHSNQPSSLAQIVFVILFSGLVVALGFIFISLKDVDRDSTNVFDVGHEDHGEMLHEEHLQEALHEDHAHHDAHAHEESEVRLEDFFTGWSSLLSFNTEPTKETEQQSSSETVQVTEDKETDDLNIVSPESSTDQGILEEYVEEITEPPPIQIPEEPLSPEVYPKTTTPYPVDDTSYSINDYSEPSESEELLTSTIKPKDLPTSSIQPEDLPIPSIQPEVLPTSTIPPEDDDDDEQMMTDIPTTVVANIDDDADDEFDSFSVYDRADITNQADYEIRGQLDDIVGILEKSPENALVKCEEFLTKHPESPRLHYMKAQALDNLAESHRSNKHLEEAIAAYHRTMSSPDVPDKLYLLAGKRAADRLRFRGFTGKSIKVLIEMSNKYPLDIDLKNQVAVGYLLIGQNNLAKKALLEVLKIAPHSGIAKVHLGFILKTADSKYSEAIKYLSEGIATREPGVIDGRFYFHLGDALHRSGKKEEALKVYEEGVKEGLFLSVYQRSLYNVNSLTGKPWWEPQSTRYAPDIKLLEKKWVIIRDEALSLIDQKSSGFMPEAEGLQEKGDWKQFELFARGRKIEKNCQKAPKTCALISQIPDAANCKRGQVKFSIMHPDTHVWAHTGPTNCRLRAHLGLVVPEGASIRVADEIRKWEEGKVVMFDDSFEHEVWHNGSTYRLVLIVDFWHPELTAYQKRSLTPI